MIYSYQYGGKQGQHHKVEIADDLVVVRTRQHKSLQDAVQSAGGQQVLAKLTPIASFGEADVTILQCMDEKTKLRATRDAARKVFKKESDIRFAGRVLREENHGNPVAYTENLFVKFSDDLEASACESILAAKQLSVKKQLSYANNCYFVGAQEGVGLNIFQLSQDLLDMPEVELCHPELIKLVSRRAINPNQWHLAPVPANGIPADAHVNVEAAWSQNKGEGIVIAVIDDGVDIDHEELASNGKIVAPRDATQGSDDPRPKFSGDNHGTACAGVACADGNHGASGVAPKAKLMPIRLRSGLGSQAEADAFVWAADNGADVISCSWGPLDGQWWNPNDQTHNTFVALPDSTRLAINHAINIGRNGKGCVVTWAAGNGRENVENDGYASYEKVIAVAACNDTSRRSVYSDFGASVWCTFPSSDFGHAPFNHPDALTPGIWTIDRGGVNGYNPGDLNPSSPPPGDDHGNYTNDFGGTSSACPGVAGVAALILAANPALTWQQVKSLIRQACERIDVPNGDYNSEGHSPFYGYGRPDAGRAVALAMSDEETDQVETLTLQAETQGTLAAKGDEKGFKVQLNATTRISLDGPGTIDFDLYAKRGDMPTTSVFDQRAYTSSADETLTIEPDEPGEFYIMVRSFRGSGSFRLRVEQL